MTSVTMSSSDQSSSAQLFLCCLLVPTFKKKSVQCIFTMLFPSLLPSLFLSIASTSLTSAKPDLACLWYLCLSSQNIAVQFVWSELSIRTIINLSCQSVSNAWIHLLLVGSLQTRARMRTKTRSCGQLGQSLAPSQRGIIDIASVFSSTEETPAV